MKRAMEKLFPNMNGDDFGQYAGIAQQYIFHYSRMHRNCFNGVPPWAVRADSLMN